MDYKKKLLKNVSGKEVEEWLKKNPKPKKWEGDKYSYAYTEMPVGSIATWWRKNIYGWNI